MDRIVWDKAHSVGIAELDAQLREVAELINLIGERRCAATPAKGVEPVVDTLGTVVARHCSRKERLLAKPDRERLWPKRAPHYGFAATLRRYRARLSEGAFQLQALHGFLVSWWHEHVRETQAEFSAAGIG